MINASQDSQSGLLRYPGMRIPNFPGLLRPRNTDPVSRAATSSIEGAADAALKRFDGNGDGSIDIATESRSKINPNIHYIRKPEQQSIERLARGADLLAGNGDGKATRDEIVALMRKFDIGSGAEKPGFFGKLGCSMLPATAGDGKLTGVELHNFNASFGIEGGHHFNFPGIRGRFPHFPKHPGAGHHIGGAHPLPYYPGGDSGIQKVPLAQQPDARNSIT